MIKEVFDRKNLMSFINIQDERTITSYIRTGVLPKPLVINREEYWPHKDILSILGITHIPNEPFMTSADTIEYLGLNEKDLSMYVIRHAVPNYRLFNKRGSQMLFLRSELDAFLHTRLEWDETWCNDKVIRTFIEEVVDELFYLEAINKNNVDTELALAVLMGKKSVSETAKTLGLKDSTVRGRFIKWSSLLTKKIKQFNADYAQVNDLLKSNSKLMEENRQLRLLAGTKESLNKLSGEGNKTERVSNFMYRVGVETLDQLSEYKMSDIKKFRNIGSKSIKEMTAMLNQRGLDWKSENPINF